MVHDAVLLCGWCFVVQCNCFFRLMTLGYPSSHDDDDDDEQVR